MLLAETHCGMPSMTETTANLSQPSSRSRAGYSVCLLCGLCRRDCWAGSKQSRSILCRRAGPLVKPAGRVHSCWRLEGIRCACVTASGQNAAFNHDQNPLLLTCHQALTNSLHSTSNMIHLRTAVFGRRAMLSSKAPCSHRSNPSVPRALAAALDVAKCF